MLVALAMMMLLLGAALSVLDSGTRNERGQQARDQALTELRQAMSRVTRDVRQATAVAPTSTRSRIDMQTLVGGLAKRIIYDVDGTDFRRTDCPFAFTASCTPSNWVLVAKLNSNLVFCYDYDPPNCLASGNSPPPAPAFTALRVELSTEPEVFSGGPIRIATDVELRNI